MEDFVTDKTKITAVDTAIERLRASKEKHEARQTEHGKKAGLQWARDFAEYGELERVSDIDEYDAEDAGQVVRDAVDPDHEIDDYNTFAEHLRISPRNFGDIDFMCAFIDGAQDFFNEVGDKL
jgi:hypothetical protein